MQPRQIKAAIFFALAIGALSSSIWATAVSAMEASGMAGAWTAVWDNNTKNVLSLAASNGQLTGTYVNDAGASCGVSGTLDSQTGHVALHVNCPGWDIDMEGTLAADGQTVAGTYLAYGNSKGQFSLSRR